MLLKERTGLCPYDRNNNLTNHGKCCVGSRYMNMKKTNYCANCKGVATTTYVSRPAASSRSRVINEPRRDKLPNTS